MAATSKGDSAERSSTTSPSSASPSSRSGSDSESGSAAKRSASVTLSSGISTSADELGERGRAAELQLEAGPGLLEAGEGVAGVHRQADGAAGVGDAAGDGLADPPRGVGGELEALAPVELLDGVHEAEVALLDEVEQRQARRLVLLGDRHHETQVRLHEGALGVLALADGAPQLALACRREVTSASSSRPTGGAGLDGLGEADLVVLGEQRVLPDVGEVETDEVFLVAFDALLGHCTPRDSLRRRERCRRPPSATLRRFDNCVGLSTIPVRSRAPTLGLLPRRGPPRGEPPLRAVGDRRFPDPPGPRPRRRGRRRSSPPPPTSIPARHRAGGPGGAVHRGAGRRSARRGRCRASDGPRTRWWTAPSRGGRCTPPANRGRSTRCTTTSFSSVRSGPSATACDCSASRAQPGRGTDQGIGSGRRGREQLEPPLGPPAGMLGLLGDQRLDVELGDLRHPPTEQPEEHLLDPAVPTQPLPRPRRPRGLRRVRQPTMTGRSRGGLRPWAEATGAPGDAQPS